MRKLFLTLMTIISLDTLGQVSRNEDTFDKTYTQFRIWRKVDTTWVYTNGSNTEWTIQFNVDFKSHPESSSMYGAFLVDSKSEPFLFCNYLGNQIKGQDEFGEYYSQEVDILMINEENKVWEFSNVGELRHYANWTYLYIGNPSELYFSYFKPKS